MPASSEQKKIADLLRAAVDNLNETLEASAKAGLHVELSAIDITHIGSPGRQTIYHATIEIREPL